MERDIHVIGVVLIIGFVACAMLLSQISDHLCRIADALEKKP